MLFFNTPCSSRIATLYYRLYDGTCCGTRLWDWDKNAGLTFRLYSELDGQIIFFSFPFLFFQPFFLLFHASYLKSGVGEIARELCQGRNLRVNQISTGGVAIAAICG